MRTIVLGLSFTLVAAAGFAQALPNAPTPISTSPLPISISNSPDVWHADVLESASVLSVTGADQAVRWVLPAAANSTGRTPTLIRALELAGVDFPAAIFFVGLDHELGHQFRASELRIPSRLRVIGSPWSVHPFLLEPDIDFYPTPNGLNLFDLRMESSGLEAVWVLKDRAETRLLRQERVGLGDAVTGLVASTHTPVYALTGVASDAMGNVGFAPQGDIANYVYQLGVFRLRAGREGPTDLLAAVRRRCMLNLIDFGLWTDVAGVWTWLARGEASRSQSWIRIGRVGVIPALRYSLTPIGPEFSVRSHVRVGPTRASAYVRWSEPIGNARQKGAGIAWLAPAVHGFEPTIRLDGWAHTVNGAGARGEIAVTTPGWPSARVAASAAFGIKSSGYLEGYPLARATYGTLGLNIAVR